MRKKCTKSLSVALALWFIACLATFFVGLQRGFLDPTEVANATFGTTDDLRSNRVAIDITEIKDGAFYGTVQVTLRTHSALLAYEGAQRFLVVVDGVHISEFIGQFPVFIEMKEIGRRENEIALSSDGPQRLVTYATPTSFPWDRYRTGVSISLNAYPKDADLPIKIEPVFAALHVAMSKAHQVRVLEEIPSAISNQVLGHVKGDEALIEVERPLWYRAMVLAMLGVCFVPLLIAYSQKESSLSIDFLTVLFSIGGIRGLLLGSTPQVHGIDLVFGAAMMLFVFLVLWGTFNQTTPKDSRRSSP